MFLVFGNSELDDLLQVVQSEKFIDVPSNPWMAANYVTRAARFLLGDEIAEGEHFEDFVLDSLEHLINEFLRKLNMSFANVDLCAESCDPYNFFFILELNDGCTRQGQYPRHGKLLTAQSHPGNYQHQFQRM